MSGWIFGQRPRGQPLPPTPSPRRRGGRGEGLASAIEGRGARIRGSAMRARIARKIAKRSEQGIGTYSEGKVARAKQMVEREKQRQQRKQAKKTKQAVPPRRTTSPRHGPERFASVRSGGHKPQAPARGRQVPSLALRAYVPPSTRPQTALARPAPLSTPLKMGIRGESAQPRVLDGTADREVVEVLEAVAGQAEQLVEGIVEVAADAGTAHTGCLRFQVKNMPQDARLPEEPAIPPRPALADGVAQLGNHPQRERSVGGNLLMTADALGQLATISLGQQEQPQVRRTASGPRPGELGATCRAQGVMD